MTRRCLALAWSVLSVGVAPLPLPENAAPAPAPASAIAHEPLAHAQPSAQPHIFSGRSELQAYFDTVHSGPGVWKYRHYFDVYARHFDRFRGRNITFVEVGIYSGGSLRMWRKFFGPQARIIGIDLSPSTRVYEKNPVYGSPDRILVGDQGSGAFWEAALAEIGDVDVLLDDGGHASHMQNVTLNAVFPKMKPGGVYMVEDLALSNRAFWEGVTRRFITGDGGMHNFEKVKECTKNPLFALKRHPRVGCVQPAVNADQLMTAALTFHPQMVVLEKYATPSGRIHHNGLRPDMHGDSWQPPLKMTKDKVTGRVNPTFGG